MGNGDFIVLEFFISEISHAALQMLTVQQLDHLENLSCFLSLIL